MTEPKLKPCPFCGGTATIFMTDGEYSDACYICCDDCGCGIPLHNTERDAIERWNRRVESDNE